MYHDYSQFGMCSNSCGNKLWDWAGRIHHEIVRSKLLSVELGESQERMVEDRGRKDEPNTKRIGKRGEGTQQSGAHPEQAPRQHCSLVCMLLL